MINKIFKTFHSAIENDIAASLGDFAIEKSVFLRKPSSETVVTIFSRFAKRAFDFMFASVFLTISLPLFFIISAAVRLTSRGPVFFRQERIGYHGKSFWIWKFRTMHSQNSENEHRQYVESLLDQNDQKNNEELLEKYVEYLDRRITKVGRFLRASSLDELPQLFNILMGDMSLVGPRPHPAYEVNSYKKWYRRRLNVKPGLTGWSKLNLRFTPENYEEAVLYDLWYVDNWSIGLDFRILLMTIPFVLSMKDAT